MDRSAFSTGQLVSIQPPIFVETVRPSGRRVMPHLPTGIGEVGDVFPRLIRLDDRIVIGLPWRMDGSGDIEHCCDHPVVKEKLRGVTNNQFGGI